jgi:hypothetical protein
LFLSVRSTTGLEPIPDSVDVLQTVKELNRIVLTKAGQIQIVKDKMFDSLEEDKKAKFKIIYDLYKKFFTVPYIPVIDLVDIDKYHKEHKALHNEKGEIIKDKNGWDLTDFNSLALSECSFSGMYEKEGQPPKMIFTDASLPKDQSLFLKHSHGVPTDIPPSSVIVCLSTFRGDQIYDVDTKVWIKNRPDEAKAVARITVIRVLIDHSQLYSKIEELKKKIGDKKLKPDL